MFGRVNIFFFSFYHEKIVTFGGTPRRGWGEEKRRSKLFLMRLTEFSTLASWLCSETKAHSHHWHQCEQHDPESGGWCELMEARRQAGGGEHWLLHVPGRGVPSAAVQNLQTHSGQGSRWGASSYPSGVAVHKFCQFALRWLQKELKNVERHLNLMAGS